MIVQEELVEEIETVEEPTEIGDELLTSLPLACANCFWRVDGDTSSEVCSGNCI